MKAIESDKNSFRIAVIQSAGASFSDISETARKIRICAESSKPDIMIFNGDTVTDVKSEYEFEKAASMLSAAVIASGSAFAVTFGDKDNRLPIPVIRQLEIWRSFGCLTEAGSDDADGCGNCVIPVSAGERVKLRVRLFDSHAETTDYERDYGSPSRSRLPYPLYSHYYMDGVRFNQTMWLRRTFDPAVPEILFFHIPTPEHAQLPLNAADVGFDGCQNEEVRCQTVNGGLTASAAETGCVCGIFCGNDERNDFFGRWCGMIMGIAPSFGLTGTAHLIDAAFREARVDLSVSRIRVS